MAARKTEFIADPSQPTVVMKRVFDAPRRLVWEAMTRPEHVGRWYGPHGSTTVECKIDLREGGAYRIVQREPDGNEYGFKGVYREIVAPSRLVYTFIFEPMPDKETVVTDTFEEQGGKTSYTSTTVFDSVEDRDGFLATGAETGAVESMERVDEVLRSIS